MTARDKAAIHRDQRRLTREKKIIEAGWQTLRPVVLPGDPPAVLVEEMRRAFFAGARHLLTEIAIATSYGPDEGDAVIDAVDAELDSFVTDLARKHGVVKL